jgi:hypothetical protein
LALFVAHFGHHFLRERHLAAAHFGRFVRAVLLVRGFALCAEAVHSGGWVVRRRRRELD